MNYLTISDLVGFSTSTSTSYLGQFCARMATLLQNPVRKNVYPWNLNGGWEGWFQVEFASYLSSFDIAYHRETEVAPNAEASSYFIPDFFLENRGYQSCIEIKCWRPASDADSFFQELEEDLSKLKGNNVHNWLIIAVAPAPVIARWDPIGSFPLLGNMRLCYWWY